jgi:hypothetical protein
MMDSLKKANYNTTCKHSLKLEKQTVNDHAPVQC